MMKKETITTGEKWRSRQQILGKKNINSQPILQGNCEDFCPLKELRLRTKERLLHHWETRDKELVTVKEYSRPAAGQLSPDSYSVRTPSTLMACTRYLMSTVLRIGLKTQCGPSDLQDLYDYIFDRLRSIRQDLVLQDLSDKTTLHILSVCVRFHMIFGHLLSNQPLTVYSGHINSSHQLECVKSCLLLDGYDEMLPAIYLLSNMDSPSAMSWATGHRIATRGDNCYKREDLLSTCLYIAQAFSQGNFVRFFKRVRQLPIILQIAASKYCQLMAHHAVKVLCFGYSSKNAKYPTSLLSNLLWIPESSCVQLCQHHGQQVDNQDSCSWIRWTRGDYSESEDSTLFYQESLTKLLDFENIPDLIINSLETDHVI